MALSPCNNVTFDVTVVPKAAPPGKDAYDPPRPFIEATEWRRLNIEKGSILHVRSDNDACVSVDIMRLARCINVCDLEELRYCFPQGCVLTYLPAGLYEVRVKAQDMPGLAVGDAFKVSVMKEEVGADFNTYFASLAKMVHQGCC